MTEERSATVQQLISSHQTILALCHMRAHSQNDRVPTELDIKGGYLSIVDGTSPRSPRRHPPTPRVAATVETGSNPA